MEWLSEIRIFGKLLIGFMAFVMVAAIMGIASIGQISQSRDISTELNDNWLPNTEHVAQMSKSLSDLRENELQHILAANPEQKNTIARTMGQDQRKLEDTITSYDNLNMEKEERELHKAFRGLWDKYVLEHKKIIGISNELNQQHALQLYLGSSAELFNQMRHKLADNLALNIDGGMETNQRSDSLHKSTMHIILLGLVIMLLFGIGMSFVLARHIVKPINTTTEAMHRMANGHEDIERLEVIGADEPSELLASFNRVLQKFHDIRMGRTHSRMPAMNNLNPNTQPQRPETAKQFVRKKSGMPTGNRNLTSDSANPEAALVSDSRLGEPDIQHLSDTEPDTQTNPATQDKTVKPKEIATASDENMADLEGLDLDSFFAPHPQNEDTKESPSNSPRPHNASGSSKQLAQQRSNNKTASQDAYDEKRAFDELQQIVTTKEKKPAGPVIPGNPRYQDRMRASWSMEIRDGNGQRIKAKLVNIGADGLSLLCPNNLQAGDDYEAVMFIPDPQQPTVKKEVKCRFKQGSAILANGGEYRIEATMTELEDSGKAFIKQWMGG